MRPLNREFSKEFNEERYWNGLEINYNKINDQWEEIYIIKLEKALFNLNLQQLKELCHFGDVDFIDNKEELIKKIKGNSSFSKEIYYLREFQSKKKKAISEFYEWNFKNSDVRYDLSSLSKLFHLYKTDKTYLFDVFTLNKWSKKSSGTRYLFATKIGESHIKKIGNDTNYIKKLIDTLHSGSRSHNYKMLSTATHPKNKIIVLIYKQMSDTMLPDFDENKRNKKVTEIMFEVNMDSRSVSIKTDNKIDQMSLLKYFKENFDPNLHEYKLETFTDFSKENFELLFTEGELAKRTKFNAFVSAISLHDSHLWKSPEFTLELKEDDIWPAVVECHSKGIIRPRSLKDFKYIKLTFNNVSSKKIYTNVEPNGDIIFRLHDANLSKEQLDEIYEWFKQLFGLPINQPISNNDFVEGKADLVDFIMKQTNPTSLTESSRNVFERLIEEKIIIQEVISGYTCSNEECDNFYEELPEGDCDGCDNPEYVEVNKTRYNLNLKELKEFTKRKFKKWTEQKNYSLLKNTSITFFGKKYELVNIEKDYKPIQFLLTNELIPTRTINRFKKLLTPIIIVYVGYNEADFINQSSDNIFPINFGKIFAYDQADLFSYLDNVVDILESRAATIVAQASSIAYESLLNLSTNEEYLESYSDREFEDDVFAIIKDIFPNADKWGSEMSGERVPEGLFSLQYNIQVGAHKREYRRLFSFDCKLTKKAEGYDLGISEKRKAWDYIDQLHKIRDITKYSDNSQVSGHIFITNKFKESQIEGIRSFFNEKMGEEVTTMPIFLEEQHLILIHKLYRQNHEKILVRRDTFYEELHKLLVQEDGIITEEDINNCFEEILGQEPEQRFLNTERVRKNLKR